MPSLSVLKRSARELIEPRNPRSSSTQQSQQSSWSDSGSQSTSAATTSGRSDEGFRTTTDAGTTSSVTTVRADRGASASGHGRERSGNGPYGSVSSSGGATPVKERRSSSKRELLHDLISRSRLMGKAALTPQRERGRGESSPSDRTTPQQSSTATSSVVPSSERSLSPRSPVNPNKPLPSPPPPGSEQATGPPAKPILKLDRIMANLTESDVEKLFSGAPQFFARSEGHFTGAPHPSVAFPWDEALEIRDLTDHSQIEDKAWSCATAWPHITRDVQADPSARRARAEKRRAHFYIRCRERPSMLSMSGLEKGSMGYQAALELGVADARQEEQFGFESLATRAPIVFEHRQKMLASKEGLRHLEETAILEQLIKNGVRYSQPHPRERRTTSELYNELFLKVLHPPTKVLDHHDPYSLTVQIRALLKVLTTPNMWIDFSHVEWRIRLGQLLWGSEEDVEEGANVTAEDASSEIYEERYWLLLQVLLASELLIRLDAITEGDELGLESVDPAEVHRFERDANHSVRWSLHLARAWLENIEVVRTEQKAHDEPQPHHGRPYGWLATLTKRMSLTHEHGSQQHHLAPNYMIRGRHWKQQVDGLTHFATKLRWPDMEAYAEKISDNCRAVTEGTPFHTPLVTPASRDSSHRSSYFGGSKGDANSKKRPAGRRTVSAALRPSGWLSKSYVSGLMLPGEGISHFLISTLLENDQDALARLGPMANLYGGFVYGGKSFWSKACVVGRVLVAGKGAAECMGWISSDVTPEGLGDGWADIEVEDIPEDVQAVHKKARLWAKASVERDSDVLGGADPTSVLPADFIIPFENIYKQPPPYLTIELKSLNLYAPVDSVHTTPTGETPFSEVSKPPGIQAYTASITFRVSEEAGDQSPGKDLTFSLSNNVHFVTAHPCVPSSRIKIIKSPSSPTVQQVDISGSGAGGKQASVLGHPLHKFYTYTAIHLSDLLAARDSSLETLLSNYTSTPHCPSLVPNVSKAAKVLVVDCITGFKPPLQEHEIPLSPVVSRSDSRTPQTSTEAGGSQQLPSEPSATESVLATAHAAASQSSILRATEGEASGPTEAATKKMHHETRRRQFGSDMEILVRAFCAEKGWNALISRRRRGCLACAIREAGALGWKVIIRVD